MIGLNIDKPEYQWLAWKIRRLHDFGYTWSDSQAIALAEMTGRERPPLLGFRR